MFLAVITVWSADVSDPGRAWKTRWTMFWWALPCGPLSNQTRAEHDDMINLRCCFRPGESMETIVRTVPAVPVKDLTYDALFQTRGQHGGHAEGSSGGTWQGAAGVWTSLRALQQHGLRPTAPGGETLSDGGLYVTQQRRAGVCHFFLLPFSSVRVCLSLCLSFSLFLSVSFFSCLFISVSFSLSPSPLSSPY